MNFLKDTRGGITIIIMIAIILMFALLATGGLWSTTKSPADLPFRGNHLVPAQSDNNNRLSTLQLRTIPFVSITLTPQPTNPPQPTTPPYTPVPTVPPQTGTCNYDNGVPVYGDGLTQPVDPNNITCKCNDPGEWMEQCVNHVCIKLFKSGEISNPPASGCNYDTNYQGLNSQNSFDAWCRLDQIAPRDGVYCIHKPIVYLYPTSPAYISVHVQTPGSIYISDPPYEQGWDNIFAQPNGSLTYKNKHYSELFYESNIQTFLEPTSGLTLTSNNLADQLDSILAKLGLIQKERNEFVEYWVPVLQNLHTPFIQFSLLDPAAKNAIDRLVVTPEPDTRIELIAYFKPIQIPFDGSPLLFPAIPPKRVGFTMVEWGGIVENNTVLY